MTNERPPHDGEPIEGQPDLTHEEAEPEPGLTDEDAGAARPGEAQAEEDEAAAEEAEAAAGEPPRPVRRTAGGYRGALEPRDDRLATVWLGVVLIIFVMIFVLAFLGIPSRLIDGGEPTPDPLPQITPPAVDVSPEVVPEPS